MDIHVAKAADGSHVLSWNGRSVPCAVGRTGIRLDKREGDGGTPVGSFTLRRVLYRADRIDAPRTGLPVSVIARDDGWCDDPAHPDYNRPVKLPFAASHEDLWLDSIVYNIIVILGHNDDPPVPGLGSAVFFHLTGADYGPTAGCVAVQLPDMLAVLADAKPGDRMVIAPSPQAMAACDPVERRPDCFW
ncbi:L,D-transpeptidase family protein [Niveispirillum sp. KHB5.9]|uniref:L,D-transpeptidase family protein n=1 Tax=Niveispirillum sp. KHB5.9 TaxID=3400269 RepID=UPI003A8568D3